MLMTALYNAAYFSKDELALRWVLFELRDDPGWRPGRAIPLVAGISGTAPRLHSLFLWLRPEGVTEAQFARAMLGWMLSTEDHSIYEIVRGIEVASPHLFGDPDIPYVDPLDLYRRVLPLETLAEIAASMTPAGEGPAR